MLFWALQYLQIYFPKSNKYYNAMFYLPSYLTAKVYTCRKFKANSAVLITFIVI